ncbi:MAG: peptide deformylase [Mariprofundaceae bacterium]|nr:peptide deformylase [Mariprofundaceae bacterium]
MAICEILTYPDAALREVTRHVDDPQSDEVRQLVQDLADTMYNAPGVGLAAPQIGVFLRVAITDTRWREEDGVRDLQVWINPEILYREGETVYEEGCLSVPGIYEDIKRSMTIGLRWLDLEGNRHEADFNDFQAVALQHEFDHLDGRLFIDLLPPIKQKLLKKRLQKKKRLSMKAD